MAIIFEEDKSFSEVLLAILLSIIVLVAGIFFIWKIFFIHSAEIPSVTNNEPSINTDILNDPRTTALEIFPEIPAPPQNIEGNRENPFAENTGKPLSDGSAKADNRQPASGVAAGTQ